MLRGVRRLGEALGPGLSHAVSQAVRASGATDLGTAELSLISLIITPGVTVTQELGCKPP